MTEPKVQTWRCCHADCPIEGQWQPAPAGVTAEASWLRHVAVVHGGKTP